MEVGKRYLFMTVTFYWAGTIVSVTPSHATIEKAVLVKDLGEHPMFLEPFPEQEVVERTVLVALPGTTIIALG